MHDRLPRFLLSIALVAHGAAYAWLLWLRHARFATVDFDLGIFDQNVWLLSQGQSFLTVRGLEAFGHHASFGHYLFVPFYWLGAGPDFLNLAMVAATVAAAVVVFRSASSASGSEWVGLALAVAFALHPTTTWLLQESYHPEVMAIAPLLLAHESARRSRWAAMFAWAALAASFKEDVALATAMLGVVVALRGQRRPGLALAGVSLAWFVFVIRVLLPAYTPGGAFFQEFYAHLGETPGKVIERVLLDPGAVLAQLGAADAARYVARLTASYALLPFASPLALLAGLPQTLANLLSQHSFTWSPRLHYAAVPLAAATMAMVDGVCGLRTPRRRLVAAMAVLACAALGGFAYGVGPGSREFRAGYWPLVPSGREATLERAVRLPGPTSGVSATYTLVPHLSRREKIYRFPNPWWPAGWGVKGENPHPPEVVDWVILDRLLLGEEDAALAARLVEDRATWKAVLDRDDVVVLQRRR